jgi:hypothetical protein
MKKNITTWLRACSLLGAFVLLSFTPNKTNILSGFGYFKTETGEGIIDVSVNFNSNNPLFPSTTQFFNAGGYTLPNGYPLGTTFTITPTRDDNDLNGVTTYDLLLMSKHILGVTPLISPYKIIAADVNKSGSVTTFDIVELRKVILGIYPTLPNNTSWRFVDLNYVFPDAMNPFSSVFPEFVNSNVIQFQLDEGFIGFKVGDLNNNAQPHFQSPIEERNTGTLYLETQDRLVEKDEIFTVNFNGSEAVLAGQFTLKYEKLELLKVLNTEGISVDNFAIFKEKNAMTCSFLDDNKGKFSLVFKANQAGKLSEMMQINSDITKAEAYNLEEAKLGIELKFNQNSGNNGTNSVIGGYIRNEMQAGISEVIIKAMSTSPIAPSFNTTLTPTDIFGFFNVNTGGIPLGSNAIIKPEKNDNFLNGVSTYDLLLMSKHILGVVPLTSPYKMIAADVNKSGSITTFDIIELRKTILGVYTEFPANTSWRFVDASFMFSNPLNPFAVSFPETRTVSSIQTNGADVLFVGFKVGDMNGNAAPNFQAPTEERNAGTLYLETQDRMVEKGETFTVNFKGSEAVLGGQFTLKYENLDLVEILKTDGISADNFAVFTAKNALTCSFLDDNKGEFSLVFKANQAGKLSELLQINSDITKAEAYNLEDLQYEVQLRFKEEKEVKINENTFKLYPNAPNPFLNKTSIEFYLPLATAVTLTVLDETGRVLLIQKGDFEKGKNAFNIDLNTTGVLLYKVETSTQSLTRKMVCKAN